MEPDKCVIITMAGWHTLNTEKLFTCKLSGRYSGDIRDQNLKLSEVDLNVARFWLPIFFEGRAPKTRDVDYKIEPSSDHVAKFRGDRPTGLGDLAVKTRKKRKRHHQQNTRPPVTNVRAA